MEKLKDTPLTKELRQLIFSLTDEDFYHFCSNYNITFVEQEYKGRYEIMNKKLSVVCKFIDDLQDDEDTIQEVISEIYFNTETDY